MAKQKSQRGGSHEDHVRAGRAGGMATASVHQTDNFYSTIGSIGGSVSSGNFKYNRNRAKEAGRRGGLARGKNMR